MFGYMENWTEAVEAFDSMLDEVYEDFKVGNMTYMPSRVLREVDPIAYRCLFMDWADGEGIDTDALLGVDDLP